METPTPFQGLGRVLSGFSRLGHRWDFKMRVRGPEMFSPPELDVANGCESKLSLHGKTNTPGQMELLTHDGRSHRLV